MVGTLNKLGFHAVFDTNFATDIVILEESSELKYRLEEFLKGNKNIWAPKNNIKRENLICVSIMPCIFKKYECTRSEFSKNGNPDVGYSLTTREYIKTR